MKRILYIIFGILLVLVASLVLVQIHFTALSNLDREMLIRVDRIGELVTQRKERIQDLQKWSAHYDFVARNPLFFVKETQEHFSITEKYVLEATFPAKQRVYSQLAELRQTEFQVIQEIAKIGFKEFGAIGYMRRSIHELEQKHPKYLTEILTLRRDEKDFLMRNDSKYKLQLDQRLNYLENQVNAPDFSNYRRSIDYVANGMERLWSDDGLFEKWNLQTDKLQQVIRSERTHLLHQYDQRASSSFQVQLYAYSILLLLVLILGVVAIRLISKQVKILNYAMEAFIFNNYDLTKLQFQSLPKNEIGLIARHFLKLARKIHSDMQELEGRVARRTAKLHEKNELLLRQHQEMLESLTYAREIQQAIMTSREKIRMIMPNAHVFYAPKEQVGGDFFWMKNTQIGNEPHILFALADCTGHGVPGALLSMIGLHFLDDLFGKGIHDPATLLVALREKISQRLHSENGQRRDGMDIAIFSLNLSNGKLIFSGAQMPLWIIRKDHIIELQPTKQPVGFYETANASFEEIHFQLETQDQLLLFTDGLVDQFGGQTDKKWGKKRLREIILANQDNLFQAISQGHYNWKQTQEQTDDCAFLTIPWVPEPPTGILEKTDQNGTKNHVFRSVPGTNAGNIVASLGASRQMEHPQRIRKNECTP
ncbi:MAG: SpoIIE family protein phosphatase [Fluviicola sp.]|jgi:serine phosphatase RsbU (regulator of sigma subunit)